MKLTYLFLPLFAIFFLSFGLNSPGVVFQVETTYHSGSPGVEYAEMSVEGKLLKMAILPGQHAEKGAVKDEVIFRGDRKEMIVVDHSKKTYMVIDEAFRNNIKGELSMVQTEMEKMMKDLPEDVRKQIEEAQKNGANIPGMPSQKGPEKSKVNVVKTGEKATKEGYPCVKYEVLKDGQKVKELWVTDWNNIDGGGEAQAGFRTMAEFFKEMLESMPKGGPGGAPFSGPDNAVVELFSDINGFPVVTKEFDENGELESESLLKSTKRGWIDPAAFEPPSGYKRMSMGPQ